MKNHRSDFETPFGSITPRAGQSVVASCAYCDWIKITHKKTDKTWSAASRARMGLQLHALATHKEETKEYQRR